MIKNIFIKLTRKAYNKIIHAIIMDSMDKGVINSKQAHALLGAWHRKCYPEYKRL